MIKIVRVPSEMLLVMNDKINYANKIKKKMSTTSTYTYNILKIFYENGIIEYTTGNKRNKYFILTEKGKQIKKELLIVTT